jgi:hypothetical protein
MADVSGIVGLIGSAVTTAGAIFDLSKNLKNSELQVRISELNVTLAQAQNQIAGLINENRELKDELSKAKNTDFIRDPKSGVLIDNNQVPHCPVCKIPLIPVARYEQGLGMGNLKCPNPKCGAYFLYFEKK